MTDTETLYAQAEAWIAQDPDPETAAELRDLVARSREDAAALNDLAARFSGRLAFGTAGLRGEIGAGPMRMNRVLVSQAAAGLGQYLLDHPEDEESSIVIGYDGRKNSDVFARDTAEIMAGLGIRTYLMPTWVPTPVLAFAVRELNASAGVMVTASHNPPRDNGYKVYLGGRDGGAQIVKPADSEIAEYIRRVAEDYTVQELARSNDFELVDTGVREAYVALTAAQFDSFDKDVTVVYTPMHGVGWPTVQRVCKAAGIPEPHVVEAQRDPDPNFPTVSFPNPEEPGALDLALELAREVDADVVLANDPDADRLAVAVPDGDSWRQLTGNEVGLLLGWAAAERASANENDGVLACSLVSSPGLAAIAEKYQLEYAETQTGFKNISRVPGLIYGFEEALGYLVDPGKVRDKDGISALIAVLREVSALHLQDRTLLDKLREFTDVFGAFASTQVSIRVSDTREIPRITKAMRENPPTEIGGLPVTRFHDMAEDAEPVDILRFDLEGGRVLVRPSGTEPKLKCYLDAWCADDDCDDRHAVAEHRLTRMREGVESLLDSI